MIHMPVALPEFPIRCWKGNAFCLTKVAAAQNRLDQILSDPASAPASISAARSESHDFRQKHDDFNLTLEKKYPQYFELKYHAPAMTLSQLQAALKKDEALLHYAVYGKKLCLLAITRDSSQLIFREYPVEFTDYVNDYLTSIRRVSHWKAWQKTSVQLYQALILPVKTFLKDKKRLIVVSSSQLAQIPFETLLVPDGTNKTAGQQYLLQAFECQYHFSAGLFWRARQLPAVNASHGFAGFAPVFGDELRDKTVTEETSLWPLMIKTALKTTLRSKISYLPFSRKEVVDICALFDRRSGKNDTFLLHRASKERFLEVAGQYRYLHLATHGYWQTQQSKDSGIYFAGAVDSSAAGLGILRANEVFGLKLNSELAVLSSCESGGGEYVAGEGVMAISRGFFYAGARNLLVSQWKIPDKSAWSLMVSFYDHYLAGESFASALRLSKLEVLAVSQTAHPSVWGSFVLIGSQ